ncbi:PTS transporter subunit EIIC [Escherichia coli]
MQQNKNTALNEPEGSRREEDGRIPGFFQRLGRALQLPIAVLPVAALLLRFGQPDRLNVAFIAQVGGAIFDNLALIFAIGVASSWSKTAQVRRRWRVR